MKRRFPIRNQGRMPVSETTGGQGIILIFLLLVMTAPVHSTELSESIQERSHSGLVCLEPDYDFGEVLNTQYVTHNFSLCNEGSSTVTIQRVESDCDCMTTQLSGTVLIPGQSVLLQTELPLTGRFGDQRHVITINTDDPNHAVLTLSLTGCAVRPVESFPSRFDLGFLHSSTQLHRTAVLSIRNTPRELSGIQCLSPYFRAELGTMTEDGKYRIFLNSCPPLPRGELRTRLCISFVNNMRPDILIPITATVVDVPVLATEK